jgi:hypothetical protein
MSFKVKYEESWPVDVHPLVMSHFHMLARM